MSGPRRGVRALAAGLLLAVLVLGVPVVLALTIGNPLAGLPDLLAGDVTDAVVIDVLAAVALLAWAQFAIAVAAELVAAARRTPMPRIPGVFVGQQQLAHALVAAALLATPAINVISTTPPTAYSAPATATAHTDSGEASTSSGEAGPWASHTGSHADSHLGSQRGPAPEDAARRVVHLSRLPSAALTNPANSVTPAASDSLSRANRTGPTGQLTPDPAAGTMTVTITNETLWDLAVTHLGDGQRWHEIWELNHGRQQPDGAVMTEPRRLRPGWTVLVPTHPQSPPHGSPAHQPDHDGDRAGGREGASGGETGGTVGTGSDVIVEPGDILSGIAAAHADVVDSWPELWQTNRGRVQPGGERFDDPDHIEPGWRISLPATGHPQRTAAPPMTLPAEHQPYGSLQAAQPDDEPEATAVEQRPQAEPPEERPQRLGDVIPVVPTSSTQDAPRHRTKPPAEASQPHEPGQPGQSGATGAPAAQASTDHGTDPSADVVTLVGAGFGGGLLTGLSLAALAHRRRRQFRYRRPGRAISATPAQLLAMEHVVRGTGSVGIVDVTWLDQALRSLASSLAGDPRARLPELFAVRMTHEILELVLAEPAPVAPAPWVVSDGGRRWSVRRGDDLGLVEEERAYRFAPYPALVSLGYTVTGEQWLIDLEQVGLLTLTGDRGRCLNLMRFIAAELAHNIWSEELDVDLVGVGAEMARLNPDRLHHRTDPAAAIADYLARGAAVRQVLDRAGVDVLTGRLRDVDTDMLMPRVLLLAADHDGQNPGSVPGSEDDAGPPSVPGGLAAAGTGHTGHRSAVAAVVAAAPDTTSTGSTANAVSTVAPDAVNGASSRGWTISLDAAGIMQIPGLGLELMAQQVPDHEAAALAQLLAAAAQTSDQPMPPARGDQPWDAHADAAGALLPNLTLDRSTLSTEQHPGAAISSLRLAPTSRRSTRTDTGGRGGHADRPGPGRADRLTGSDRETQPSVSSVLPAPASTYVRTGATTEDDVAALAPGVSDEVRLRVEQADPSLDADLADWHDPDCPLPRLTLLGPVDVRAHGQLPEVRPRKAWNVEVVAHLACHPRGVSAGLLGTDLWPNDPNIAGKTKVRQALHITRKWLGTNPRTGRDHLPPAAPSPGGPALYRVEGLLVDAELFRRLRIRAVARGSHGIADLHAALDLVTGAPFDQRRPGGYGWLAETPLDHEYTGMIVDVAHLVATHHLAAGEPELARAAAQTALTAGSSDDIALLDLVAACDAEGNRAEADHYVRRILDNHDAEVEEDLPPRTAQVLLRRGWIGQAS